MNDREELERKIVDAVDGNLNEKEVQELERGLKPHPDLCMDYKMLMNLPELDEVYPMNEGDEFNAEVKSIRKKLSTLDKVQRSFNEISIVWFQRYALAASLMFFAITSIFSITQTENETLGDELFFEELLYPLEESVAEDYQWYLDELTNE